MIGSASNSTTEAVAQLLLPTSCTAGDLRAEFDGTINSRTVTLRANGSATSLSCSFTVGTPTCSNTGSTVSLGTGDYLSLSISGGSQPGFFGYVAFVCLPEPGANLGGGVGALALAVAHRLRRPAL